MHAADTTDQTLTGALAACNWQRKSDTRAPTFTLGTEAGAAILRQICERGGWQRFVLSGGTLPTATRAGVFYENSALYGPAKFVAGRDGPAVCLVDVPAELETEGDSLSEPMVGADDRGAYAGWAEAVTALVKSDTVPSRCQSFAVHELIEHLSRRGLSPSAEDDRVKVQVPLVGGFFEVTVQQGDELGTVVASELAPLDERSRASLRATFRLAHEATLRLPLARVSVSRQCERQVAKAEVHLGRAAVSFAWLLAALHSVESAVRVIARELQAVADPQLAGLVLAAPAAFTSVSEGGF